MTSLKFKIGEWLTILTLCASLAFGYGTLNSKVANQEKQIDSISMKLDRIYGDTQVIKGYLTQECIK